jgi:hypothetical protein
MNEKTQVDAHHHHYHQVNSLREWFRLYKTAEGKGENKFGLDEKAMDKEYTVPVVMETHEHWLAMMGRKPSKNLFEKIMAKVQYSVRALSSATAASDRNGQAVQCFVVAPAITQLTFIRLLPIAFVAGGHCIQIGGC